MQQNMSGARLAYTVVKLEGTVKRRVARWTKKAGLDFKEVEEPAGYMVYFPRGHAIRIKDREGLRVYGLDQDPPIVNLSGLQDPRSPLGKLFMSQDDATRRGAMRSLEDMVISLATHKTGKVLMPEQLAQEELPV